MEGGFCPTCGSQKTLVVFLPKSEQEKPKTAPQAGGRDARFEGAMDEAAAALNASVDFDRRLLREDVRGSQAHARMLAEVGSEYLEKCITVMHTDAQGIMKAITVRNLPPDVARAVRQRATKDQMSANRAIIALLQAAQGRRRGKRLDALHHDLDRLAGTWSREEALAFSQALREQRTVDPDLWK